MAEMTLQEAIDHAREVANGLHPNIDGCSACAKQHGQLADWLEELRVFKRVGATPADVRPVVRGGWEWNYKRGLYYCSECGEVAPRENQDGEYCDCPNYCPNCGYDMRGGDAE